MSKKSGTEVLKERVARGRRLIELEERLREAASRAASERDVEVRKRHEEAVRSQLRSALEARRKLVEYYSLATSVGEVVASSTALAREVGPELSDSQVRAFSAPIRLSRSYWGGYLVVRDVYSQSVEELVNVSARLRREVSFDAGQERAAGILQGALRELMREWVLPPTAPEASLLLEDFRAVREAWEERDDFAREAFIEVPR